jgi:hypothetical protein
MNKRERMMIKRHNNEHMCLKVARMTNMAVGRMTRVIRLIND